MIAAKDETIGEDGMATPLARRPHAAVWLLALALAWLTATGAGAQDYPGRPIRLIVPFVPGGTTDLAARILAPRLGEDLGQQIVIDNRAGAGGTIGADLAAKSPPDGYTLLLFHVGMTYGPALYRALPYDVAADFAPIGLIGATPSLLIVNPKLPARSVADFLADAGARPGALNYGSAGPGSSSHLGVVLFESLTGARLTQVPYKGAGAAVAAMIAGEVDCMVETIGSLMGGIRSGQLRALAVTSERRVATLPDVPTLQEAGVPGFTYTTWFAMWAPARTPRPIVDRLNRALGTALTRADAAAQLAEAGIIPEASTPDALDARVRSELTRWTRVIAGAGVQPQ